MFEAAVELFTITLMCTIAMILVSNNNELRCLKFSAGEMLSFDFNGHFFDQFHQRAAVKRGRKYSRKMLLNLDSKMYCYEFQLESMLTMF